MDNRIFETVKRIAKEQLSVSDEEIKPEARFVDDIGADSLDTVEMAMTFQEEFGIEILDEDLVDLATVRQVVDYISQRLAEKTRQSLRQSSANLQI